MPRRRISSMAQAATSVLSRPGREQVRITASCRALVLAIARCDVAYTLSVLVGNRIVQVFVTEQEVADIRVGDSVLLVSKAFNPVVLKIHEKNALVL